MPATVFLPSGERREIMLEPVGAGNYQATLPAVEGGVYVVSAVPARAATTTPGSQVANTYAPVIAGVSRTEGIEYRRLTSDRATLEQIARATGGRVLRWDAPGEARLFDRTGIKPAQARLPLWRPLLWAALVVMLLDVATRRIAWDRFVSREFGDQVRNTVRATLRDRSDQAAGTLGRLREREPGREVWNSSPQRGQTEPLGDEAALEIMRRESERRRAARVTQGPAAGPTTAPTAATPSTPPSDAPSSAAPAEPPAATEPGLFAAKKRARDRMSGND